MKQEWFDKKIANEMQDFDSQMDFESAWKSIEAKRNKNKKRAIYFWLTCLGALAISGLAISFFIINNNKKTISSKQSSIAQEINEPILENNNKNIFDEGLVVNSENTPLFNKPEEKENTLTAVDDKFAKSSNENNLKINSISSTIKNKLIINNNSSPIDLKESAELITNIPPIASTNKNSTLRAFPDAISTPNIYVQYLGNKRIINTNEGEDINIHSRNKPTIHWGVDLTYGKYFRQLSATENPYTDWVNARQQLETPLDVFYTGIYIKKYFSERFFLQPGLSLLQHTARFEEFSQRIYSELVNDQLLEIVRYADGTENLIYGEQAANFTETQLVTSYQKSRSSLLQILAGLDFPINKKMGVNLSAGASISLFTSISGMTIRKELQSGKYENLSNFGYKKSGQLYGHGNAGIYLNLNKNWQLSSGIHTMIGLNNQIKKGNGFNEQFNFLGANISFEKTF